MSAPAATPGDARQTAGALDFETFAAGLDQPADLLAARRAAWERYGELPLPTRKSEEWRYTDLSKIDFASYEPVAPDGESREALPAVVEEVLGRSGERAGIVVQRNGRVVHVRLDPELESKGVVLCSLAVAAAEHPELLDRALYEARPEPMEEKLWTLHQAFLTGGYLLRIPKNVKLDAPVHVFRLIDRPGALVSTHSLVVAETGAEGAVIDEFVSEPLDALSVHAAIVEGGDNATLDYVALQRYGRGVKHFSIQHLKANRDTKLRTFNVQLGADLSRADVSSRLLGPGCSSDMLALWLGDGEQHFDHHTIQHHAAPSARSDLLFKGALTDEASSVFRGLIRVDRGAQLTDAYQTNRNLLLSDRAHATSLPNLEIEADDVRCSHGSTTGPVDEMQLFYLRSRGLTRDQAERLLVLGFFEEVLDRIPMTGVRGRLLEAIEEKTGI